MIRNRVVVLNRAAVTVASTTDGYFAQVTMPNTGRLRSISVNAVSCAGTAARTFRVYKSATEAANDTAANSTVAMCPALSLADTPLPVTTLANSDVSSASFIAGEVLYVKYTTGATTTSTDTTVTLVYDA